MTRIGIKIDGRRSEDLLELAVLAEDVGLDQLWVCEDLGLAGGIAQVAAALARTQRIEVGLGIAPAAVRNPMYLAMEFASVARMFPGRFHAGIGHGMPVWLDQVGQRPAGLMTCLEEVSEAVQALLAGERISRAGRHVRLDDVMLTHPPKTAPLLSLGVRGRKGIELCRQLGIGPILAEGSTPDYIAATRRALPADACITAFVWANLLPGDSERAHEELLPTTRRAMSNPDLAAQLGLLFASEDDALGLSELTVAGDTADCVEAVRRIVRSGADSIVLQPIQGREEEQIRLIGDYLLPALADTVPLARLGGTRRRAYP